MGDREGFRARGSSEPLAPPLDPPLHWKVNLQNYAVEFFFF